jgi:hypothetical protein
MACAGHSTKASPTEIRSILPMRKARSQSMIDRVNTPEITIRPEYPDDELALMKLAALDSADAPPPRPLLLAEVDGELRVALSLRDGSAIADPFVPTAAILALMRGHARRSTRDGRGHAARDTIRAALRGPRLGRRAPAW